MVRRRAMIEPDSRRTRLYEREIYPRYDALYGALKSARAKSASCSQDNASWATARILVKNTGVSSRSGLRKSATPTSLFAFQRSDPLSGKRKISS
jgi:hypothetical protein